MKALKQSELFAYVVVNNQRSIVFNNNGSDPKPEDAFEGATNE